MYTPISSNLTNVLTPVETLILEKYNSYAQTATKKSSYYKDPIVSYKRMAKHLGLTEKSVAVAMAKLQKKQFIKLKPFKTSNNNTLWQKEITDKARHIRTENGSQSLFIKIPTEILELKALNPTQKILYATLLYLYEVDSKLYENSTDSICPITGTIIKKSLSKKIPYEHIRLYFNISKVNYPQVLRQLYSLGFVDRVGKPLAFTEELEKPFKNQARGTHSAKTPLKSTNIKRYFTSAEQKYIDSLSEQGKIEYINYLTMLKTKPTKHQTLDLPFREEHPASYEEQELHFNFDTVTQTTAFDQIKQNAYKEGYDLSDLKKIREWINSQNPVKKENLDRKFELFMAQQFDYYQGQYGGRLENLPISFIRDINSTFPNLNTKFPKEILIKAGVLERSIQAWHIEFSNNSTIFNFLPDNLQLSIMDIM
ncbi:MAG: hypothetical protein ACRC0X_02005 [Brevinema sp.]